MRWTRQGPIAPYRLRNACQMCENFTAERADISIGMIGLNVREQLVIEARDDLAAKLGMTGGGTDGRDKAISRLTSIRHHRREEAVAQASHLLADLPSLVGLVAGCTACGECQDACPYCTCDAFAPKPAKEPHTDRLRVWPSGEMPRGAVHERSVGMLGELIELGRRAAACVGCGMCESSCQRHVPLTAIQAALGSKVREEFNYVPGRRVDERLPWAST
jgi:coenzyme F420-reducing hydrogenase beta subunit